VVKVSIPSGKEGSGGVLFFRTNRQDLTYFVGKILSLQEPYGHNYTKYTARPPHTHWDSGHKSAVFTMKDCTLYQ